MPADRAGLYSSLSHCSDEFQRLHLLFVPTPFIILYCDSLLLHEGSDGIRQLITLAVVYLAISAVDQLLPYAA